MTQIAQQIHLKYEQIDKAAIEAAPHHQHGHISNNEAPCGSWEYRFGIICASSSI
jgi:hypothetical protein